MGTYSRIAVFPRCFSNTETKSETVTGCLFPRLNTRFAGFPPSGRFPEGSDVSSAATTPATTSLMCVKSRASSFPPSPWKMVMGRPRTMLLAKEKYAISGRPYEPYTVKNRKPVTARP